MDLDQGRLSAAVRDAAKFEVSVSYRAFFLAFILIGLLVGCQVASSASVTSVYIAQSSAGSNNGSNCANAFGVTFFNSSGNWGSGGSQIGPGTTVHLCGTITSTLSVNGNGAAGNPIVVLWESGARLSMPYGQFVNLNGSFGNLVFDGGIPCGPGSNCAAVEAAHLTTYASGQAGMIEATANGSGLANQNTETQAFYNCSGCHDIEIRNMIVRNLYRHTSTGDDTDSADTGNFVWQSPYGSAGMLGVISFHDSVVHDTGNSISIQRGNATTFNIYNIDFGRNNWALEYSGNGTRTLNFHDNRCHDAANWDTADDKFHHNCVHSYMNVATDSIATNLYNNLSDGDWGSCCTTDIGLYNEVASPANFNVYNNVAIQHSGNTAPAWQYGATTGMFVNNTAIGSATTSGNSAGIQISGTNIRYENNATEGWGQYIVVQGGTTFTAFDNNQYGAIGQSGNAPWQYGSNGVNTFSSWKSVCSCDSHGANPAHLNVDSMGMPQSGSSLIGAALNLTGMGMAPLDWDTSAGDTRSSVQRPGSGAWDVGSYAYQGSGGPPAPPSGLTAIPQ
jgi:hypothetical protein